MEKFLKHRGKVVTLDRANVDTDQIIAKQFLKSIARTGFGEHLFHDWRHNADGSVNASFPLNQPRFKGATVLVARNNFGCGSSREHAVWAVKQYGFQTVVAPRVERDGSTIPGFADIFGNNCSKNALLTIELSETEVQKIFEVTEKTPGLVVTVDLEAQRLTLHATPEISFKFSIDAAIKDRLINGLDDIGITLTHEAALRAFESKHNTQIRTA